jgi:hypothetical protein
MKTFSSPGVCLIAALAPGCTSDSSQFRAFRDGAVEHPAAADVGATGAGGTASLPDAAAATGGSGDAATASLPDAPTAVGGNGGFGGSGGPPPLTVQPPSP